MLSSFKKDLARMSPPYMFEFSSGGTCVVEVDSDLGADDGSWFSEGDITHLRKSRAILCKGLAFMCEQALINARSAELLTPQGSYKLLGMMLPLLSNPEVYKIGDNEHANALKSSLGNLLQQVSNSWESIFNQGQMIHQQANIVSLLQGFTQELPSVATAERLGLARLGALTPEKKRKADAAEPARATCAKR
jgi:hypothetical protein